MVPHSRFSPESEEGVAGVSTSPRVTDLRTERSAGCLALPGLCKETCGSQYKTPGRPISNVFRWKAPSSTSIGSAYFSPSARLAASQSCKMILGSQKHAYI